MGEEIKNNKIAMSVSSLILGIISIVTVFFWYITLPTGILAIIFGAKTANKKNSKLGKAGLILGIIAVSLFALIYISIIILLILINNY